MTRASSIAAITKALPSVQAAVREEIEQRVAAGEFIGGVDGQDIVSTSHPKEDLRTRRRRIAERFTQAEAAQAKHNRKSAA